MIWNGRRESGNIIDRRMSGGKMGAGGLIVGAIIYYLMGGNPLTYVAQNMDSTQRPAVNQAQEDQRKRFAAVVLADTEDVWGSEFQRHSQNYQPPQMVLFRGRVQSACGRASSAVGPFYCPSDRRVYLDLSFFDELSRQLGAQGDFASAYVIAHEVGHHVQHQLGLDSKTQASGFSEREKNQASVQFELQADCLAGVWARQTADTKQVVEEGDVDEAINAASAVGDDRLQQMSRGEVVPDSFTHGSSVQRTMAFRNGFNGGQLQSCVQPEESDRRMGSSSGAW